MRKFFLALTSAALMVAISFADPVRVVKYDETTKTVTVKGTKKKDTEEKEYKLTDKVKFMKGEKEVPAMKAFEMMAAGKKAPKMLDLTMDKDGKVESVKFMEAKKKKDKSDK